MAAEKGGVPEVEVVQNRQYITTSSTIAEGLREALASRNPATTKHLI